MRSIKNDLGYNLHIKETDLQLLQTILANNKKEKKEDTKTLDDFREEYLSYMENQYAEKYVNSQELTLRHALKYFGTLCLLNQITKREAEKFIASLMKNAPKGYAVYLRNLKAAFNKAVEWDLINENPFKHIKFKKQQKVRPKYISSEDLQNILSNTKNSTLADLFIFAYNTGTRLSEAVHIKWENIDLKHKKITIGDTGFITKTRESRDIPINSTLFELLSELHKTKTDSAYVFPKENGFQYNADYVSRKFKVSCRLSNIDEEIHFHSLRHSFASNMANKGVSIYIIKELLGHSSVKTTEIYAHIDFDSKAKAVEVLNAA